MHRLGFRARSIIRKGLPFTELPIFRRASVPKPQTTDQRDIVPSSSSAAVAVAT